MTTTQEEAILQLRKWQEAQSPIAVMYQPDGGHLHSSLLGNVEIVGSEVFVTHKGGRPDGFISFDVQVVVRWEYHEVGDLPGIAAATTIPEVLHNRGILAAVFAGRNALMLCDATPGVLQ